MMRFIHIATKAGNIVVSVATVDQLLILSDILEKSDNVIEFRVTEPDSVHMGAWSFGWGQRYKKWVSK